MKNKIENLIKEVGVNEVEAILNQLKSKVNVKENLKKDFIDLLTGCTISFFCDDIGYLKDEKLLFYYQKKDNYFNVIYSIWVNFQNKYSLNYQELKDLLVDVLEDVLNYKGVTPRPATLLLPSQVEDVLNYEGVTPHQFLTESLMD